MPTLNETQITRLILEAYHEKLLRCLENDVLIVGAGPAGLTAAIYLCQAGLKTTVVERNLSAGGGIWGGGMGHNDVVLQEAALPILSQMNIRSRSRGGGLYTVEAAELACALVLHALQAGATLLNLITLEDVSMHAGRVSGVVINRTGIAGRLHVDPLMLSAGAVLDATGHEAVVVNTIRRRGYLRDLPSEHAMEGPLNADEGERFVVERAGQVYPGLWVAGMSVCAAFGGPRMGPIFGGMLLSGKRVAELISRELKKA